MLRTRRTSRTLPAGWTLAARIYTRRQYEDSQARQTRRVPRSDTRRVGRTADGATLATLPCCRRFRRLDSLYSPEWTVCDICASRQSRDSRQTVESDSRQIPASAVSL